VDIIDTFGFNAPAEVVYNTLTDPDRTERWLPAGVRVLERTDDGRIRLAAGSTTVDVEVDTIADDMRLTFRCTAPVQVRGTARVEDTAGAGSRIEVAVTTDSGPDPATVRDVLAQTMRHLARDVSDNFTAG
jgi:uncharacterized protein YndB with AHSA1/START domain